MDTPNIHEVSAERFIIRCRSRFGWCSLSKDVIMDVGCGETGFCGRKIREYFPDVRAIIFMDKSLGAVSNLKANSRLPADYAVADIEKRDSIRSYEGKMTKVVSTHVFHQLADKDEAFQNVYRLLKPGGEAGILFSIKSILYEWVQEMLKIPKWKAVYQGQFREDLYQGEHGIVHLKEMVEKIGFKIVECSAEKRVVPADSDDICKGGLYNMCGRAFDVAPALIQEFKDESFQVLATLSERDAQGRMCYRSTELTLLLVKPT